MPSHFTCASKTEVCITLFTAYLSEQQKTPCKKSPAAEVGTCKLLGSQKKLIYSGIKLKS